MLLKIPRITAVRTTEIDMKSSEGEPKIGSVCCIVVLLDSTAAGLGEFMVAVVAFWV